MLIFEAVIDAYTYSVCKERDNEEVFYDWEENNLVGKDSKLCEGEICRCLIREK